MSQIKGTHRVTLTTQYGEYADAGEELTKRVRAAMAANAKLDFAAATLQVGREDPQLLLRYKAQFGAQRQPRAQRRTPEQVEAEAFVTRKLRELTAGGLSVKDAQERIKFLHPAEFTAYCTR